MSTAQQQLESVGHTLVNLCNEGRFDDAMKQLYAADVVSVEAADMPGMTRETRGFEAVEAMSKAWEENHEVHGCTVKGPFFHLPNQFSTFMQIDVTPAVGPMAGQRHTMEEVCLYTLEGDRISRCAYFYELPPEG